MRIVLSDIRSEPTGESRSRRDTCAAVGVAKLSLDNAHGFGY
jgi:hypothetical protein